jgi:hypothetical protein
MRVNKPFLRVLLLILPISIIASTSDSLQSYRSVLAVLNLILCGVMLVATGIEEYKGIRWTKSALLVAVLGFGMVLLGVNKAYF